MSTGIFDSIQCILKTGFTMEKPDDRNSIHEAAKEAIDEDALARVLELAAGSDCEQDAVEALREVAADEIVTDVLVATGRARRRSRLPTGEDIGVAADERQVCCCEPRSRNLETTEALILKAER